jgi:hypothetical protein
VVREKLDMYHLWHLSSFKNTEYGSVQMQEKHSLCGLLWLVKIWLTFDVSFVQIDKWNEERENGTFPGRY